MEFLKSQENLSAGQWLLRALIAYMFMLLIMRVAGARAISHLTLPDLVTSLVIGNIIAHPLSDPHTDLKGALITTTVFALLHLVLAKISFASPSLKRLLEPQPITLIENGRIQFNGLKQASMTVDTLLAELRKNKISRLQEVALAFYEPGGGISVFPLPEYAPLTAKDSGNPAKPFEMPLIVIKDGRIIEENLHALGKDVSWLKQELQQRSILNQSSIVLATLDSNSNLYVSVGE